MPHHLVKAFKSTLDEVAFSDVLLIVSDVTDPEVPEHLKVTEDVIAELGAGKKQRIYVYNKCDKDGEQHLVSHECMVKISAKTGEGVDTLLDTIEALLHAAKRDYTLLIPYDKQSLVNSLYNDFTVKSVDYLNEGIQIVAVLDDRGKGLFKAYIKDN